MLFRSIDKKYITEAINYDWRNDLQKTHYIDAKTENGMWKLGIIDSASKESFSAQIRYDGFPIVQV